MLLKTHVGKMSETGHATISMKIKHIEGARHYIDENKVGYRFAQGRMVKKKILRLHVPQTGAGKGLLQVADGMSIYVRPVVGTMLANRNCLIIEWAQTGP